MNCLPSKSSLGITRFCSLWGSIGQKIELVGVQGNLIHSIMNLFIYFIYLFFFGAVHAPTVYGLIIFPCNIALIYRVLPFLLLFLIGLNQKLSAWLLNPLLFLLLLLWSLFLKWLPVFHLQWLGHIQHVRWHLPTTSVWNFPMQELIGLLILGFFYSTSYLQNILPVSVSSASLNLSSFRRWVYHHFRHQMAWFIVNSFLSIYVLQCSFFSYFNNSFWCLSLPSSSFPKGCRLEKEQNMSILCLHS